MPPIKPVLVFILYSLLLFTPLSFAKPSQLPTVGLPLPGHIPLVDYERKLYRWILDREYTKLGWAKDKHVRDTGPFIDEVYYGTHPAVRIYYSPEVMKWLEKGRPKDEPIPDGAMIVKEMYTPPAAIYQQFLADPKYKDPEAYEKLLASLVNNWTVMIKNNRATSDGWFWASIGLPTKGQSIKEAIDEQVDTLENRGNSELRWSGFGMPCLRCHASAENELTFSDLANIQGQPGQPLLFISDDSWRSPAYIAGTYPLCKFKHDEYVVRFMYLPPDNTPDDISCPPPKAPPGSASVFSDHDVENNVIYEIPSMALGAANYEFLSTFTEIPRQVKSQVKHFPPEWLDYSAMPADHPTEYVTSDNCIGCHGGLSGTPNRSVMFVENGDGPADGFDLSEYGEWRWSPMGLAGRDPIFHSQIESEMAYLERDAELDKKYPNKPALLKGSLEDTKNAVSNTCLSCHGAMGQRQLAKDAAKDKAKGSALDPNFKLEYFYLHERLTAEAQQESENNGTAPYDKYGALAREGISCMVCHHIDAPDAKKVAQWDPNKNHKNKWVTPKANKELAYNLFFHSTGHYNPGPEGHVFGPFDVLEKPMENALLVKPLKNHYTSDSQMCGNCHTINLPNIGKTADDYPVLTATAKDTVFEKYPHTIEQATFLEWQNSIYSETDKNGELKNSSKSCQDCHMPGSFKNEQAGISIDRLLTQIASIQDSSYPEASHTLDNDEMSVPMRDDYSRHTHVGLNVFLLSMVDQFSDVLGLQKSAYMTGSSNGIAIAMDSMVQQAQKATADIDVSRVKLSPINNDENLLTAHVSVTNKSGHRYPSGVAFRRAFIEFTVSSNGETLWQSGGTNSVGVIVDGEGEPLKTEFLPDKNSYQPHYEMIDNEMQVQIYEELNRNAQEEFTTSFVHRVTLVKDNRLLPKGWRESRFFKEQGQVMEQFMASTDPHGKAYNDKDYQSRNNRKFPGRDRLIYKAVLPAGIDPDSISVTATLYNQSIPPYWLKQRFEAAPEGEGTKRLHYLSSHLNLNGSAMENWKLLLVSDTELVEKVER